ncbi:MAG: hypothetical protein IT481_15885 [Gammaproteobacteria bacterium]|nr:hypothetical protein [Gammaproteobacteria bacterium]
MKHIIHGLFISLLIAPTAAVSQQSPENEALESEIRVLDLAHAQTIFKGDAAALDRRMADDVTVNHPTNRIVNDKEGASRAHWQGSHPLYGVRA